MKVLGLFIVVFGIALINKFLGFSDSAMMIGCVTGAGSYILLNIKES